jgi:hypothetical protein
MTRADPGLFNAKRRREILAHASHVGAADTADLGRWLIAWVWHNRNARDQIWSVMEAAKGLGCRLTEWEAAAIIDEASDTRRRKSADNLARWLGLTYDDRRALGITTIGSVNVTRRVRQELRKFRDREAKARKRRASGARPQEQSLSRRQPWRDENMSRAQWYRKRKQRTQNGRETTSSAAIFLSTTDDKLVSFERKGTSEQGFALKKGRGLTSRDGDHDAVPGPVSDPDLRWLQRKHYQRAG